MINELAQKVHENAKEKGFFTEGLARNMGEMLCLVHSEVSEAMEADRKNEFARMQAKTLLAITDKAQFKKEFEAHLKSSFEDELADIVIRVMDLAAYKGIDLQAHIEAKVRYNTTREHKHGKNY